MNMKRGTFVGNFVLDSWYAFIRSPNPKKHPTTATLKNYFSKAICHVILTDT